MARKAGFLIPAIITLFALSVRPALSQSRILNAPTTDTVEKGKVHFDFDWLAQNPNTRALNRLHIFSPNVVVGISKDVEIGANVPLYHRKFVNDWFFEPNVKWRFASSDEKGIAASVGGTLVTSINHRVFRSQYGVIYANVSKQVKSGNYSPRFTGGAYGILASGGSSGGALLGYEQPIHRKATIVVDWLSGQNALGNTLGYLTPGMAFKLPANSVLSIGYSFGNDSYQTFKGNRFVFLRYGITF